MININKKDNALVINFAKNDKFLFDGLIQVALNELMVVIDNSNMATFKRTSNGDTLFSLLISEIQIEGKPTTKETIITDFAKIGYTSGKDGVVTSVNGKDGAVVLTASDLNAYTKEEVNNLISTLETVKFKKVTVLPNVGEKNIIYLVPKAKTKKSNIYEEWIYVDTDWEMIGTTEVNLTGYATEQWVGEQGYLTEIPAEYITETELAAKGYATKSELPTFDATELFTKSQDLGTLTPTFRKNLDAAIAAKKVLYINDILNNVFAVITFIGKGNSIYSFQAVSAEVSYSLNLNINDNTVTIKLAPKGYGFNKYETEYPVSVFELTTGSTNNDILRAFSSNDNGVVIPSSGDVFEVREAGAVEGSVIRDSGIVTSRVETNGKIDLVIMSNNLVDDYYVIHNIKLSYNAAQGPDSLAVDKVTHSVIDPALLTQERQATLVTRSELPKLTTLTQAEYDLLPTKDASTYYFIKEA